MGVVEVQDWLRQTQDAIDDVGDKATDIRLRRLRHQLSFACLWIDVELAPLERHRLEDDVISDPEWDRLRFTDPGAALRVLLKLRFEIKSWGPPSLEYRELRLLQRRLRATLRVVDGWLASHGVSPASSDDERSTG